MSPEHSAYSQSNPKPNEIIQCCSSILPVKSIHHHLQLSSNELGKSIGAEALRTLNRSTQTTVNDQLGQDTKGTGNTKENGVVVGFSQAVVLQ